MSKQSRVITTVLSPAVKFWLRSQLEQVEGLQLVIEAGDRQILSGCIGRVFVSAQKAVYRGLHISQVCLAGEQIRTNLRQVLRGQPLRLLEAFPISGEVLIYEADLNASLRSSLLGNAVTDFLLTLLKTETKSGYKLFQAAQTLNIQEPRVCIKDGQITFSATFESETHSLPVVLHTGLLLENRNRLRLHSLRWQLAEAGSVEAFQSSDELEFDLGPEVSLETLILEAGQIRCQGQIMVTPEERD
jgi:hypothetical protein